MRAHALFMTLALTLPACADPSDDLAGEVDDPGTGDSKTDSQTRPEGIFYLTAGATQPGAFEALQIDKGGAELLYVLAKGGDQESTRVKARGSFKYTRAGGKKYLKFTPEDPDTGDDLPVVRFQYTWANGKLGLHQSGVAGGWSMKPAPEASTTKAYEEAIHDRFSELTDNGSIGDELSPLSFTEVPMPLRACYDMMDVVWGPDYAPVIYGDKVGGKKIYWLTEDNDGGGYAGAYDASGALIDEGWYSESEDFSW